MVTSIGLLVSTLILGMVPGNVSEVMQLLNQRYQAVLHRAEAISDVVPIPEAFVRQIIDHKVSINNLSKQLGLMLGHPNAMTSTGKTAAEEAIQYQQKLNDEIEQINLVLDQLEQVENQQEPLVKGMSVSDRQELARRLMAVNGRSITAMQTLLKKALAL